MLSREEVLKIARLARLELSEAEVEEYQRRLGRVLEHMKDLDSLSLKASDFPEHVPSDAFKLREDIAREWNNRGGLMKNAPLSEGNQFLLPAVLDRSE